MAIKPIPQIKKACKELPVEFVREILSYDIETGIFRWKSRPDIPARADRHAGKIAGFLDKDGYWVIQINKKRYPAHRLAWVIVKGTWPEQDIDHRDPPRTNNRWSNLRIASRMQNLRNVGKKPNNKSGFKWVSWSKVMRKWVAQIRDGKTNLNLGFFEKPEDAYAAACEAAKQLHEEFANFG